MDGRIECGAGVQPEIIDPNSPLPSLLVDSKGSENPTPSEQVPLEGLRCPTCIWNEAEPAETADPLISAAPLCEGTENEEEEKVKGGEAGGGIMDAGVRRRGPPVPTRRRERGGRVMMPRRLPLPMNQRRPGGPGGAGGRSNPRGSPYQSHKCTKHGIESALFKCDSCCAVATFSCAKNSMYCKRCHSPELICKKKNFPCPGVELCPLEMKHPPNLPAPLMNYVGPMFVIGCIACFAVSTLNSLSLTRSLSLIRVIWVSWVSWVVKYAGAMFVIYRIQGMFAVITSCQSYCFSTTLITLITLAFSLTIYPICL